MKRIIFTLLIALVGSVALSSCTEDEIAPQHMDAAGAVTHDGVTK
jgi:hypothetical protein